MLARRTSSRVWLIFAAISGVVTIGIAGFSSRPKQANVLDWSKLPPELRYLAEPAAKYGPLQFDVRIIDFLRREATQTDRETLRKLQPLVLRDETKINAWIDDLGIVEHREAALVYFLLHLMALGADAGLL